MFDRIQLIISGLIIGIAIFYRSTIYHGENCNSHRCENFSNCHIAGLILARGGSKGIPLKNIAKFSNTTLLGNSLRIMHEFGRFNSIWVSTDNDLIVKEANNFNVQVHMRNEDTATDTASSLLAVNEFVLKHPDVHIIGLVQCTSPFLHKQYLDQALLLLKQGYESVFSVTRLFNLRWKIPSDGPILPDNFNPLNRPRRQDWHGEIVENGMFYFTYTELIKRNGALQSGRLAIVEVPEDQSLQIDTPSDLIIANILQNISVDD